jgi:hypothetical protein
MGVNSNGTVMMDQGVFENLGSVTWDTTAKTVGFTAVSGNGYFVNTTSGAITVTLPSSPSAGDVVGIKDYANTADTNAITIGRNGSNIDGVANDFTITTEGLSALLVYVDATKGWLITNSSQASDIAEGPSFIIATGGTETTCGNFKIHTFTGPGTFTITQIGNAPTVPTGGPTNVDYLVVAGGGGGGSACSGGGGGAGGHRTSYPSPGCNAGSFPITVTAFPITVGGGGSVSNSGSNSVFSTITSNGGGEGGEGSPGVGVSGGSGGGGGFGGPRAGGSGNTPPVSPSQGNNGGSGYFAQPGAGCTARYRGGGGGGIVAVGGNAGEPSGGLGGNGAANSINGSPVTRAGGGGGGAGKNPGSPTASGGSGGTGGGGNGAPTCANATAGAVNTGGGGGGSGYGSSARAAAAGGSGIVIIRYKYQ